MMKSLAYKQSTDLSTVKTPLDLLDATLIASGAILPTVKLFTIQAESQNIRWRDDGTAPTASVGHILPAGQTMQVLRDRFANFKAIEAAASAIANVTGYDGEGFPFMPAAAGAGAAGSTVLATGTNTIGATKDAGANWTQVRGNISSADLSTAADLTAAPTAGQKIVVDDLIVSVGATAMRVDILEETTGTVLASAYLAANSVWPVTTRGKFKLDTADKKVRAQGSAAGNIRIFCLYHSEA